MREYYQVDIDGPSKKQFKTFLYLDEALDFVEDLPRNASIHRITEQVVHHHSAPVAPDQVQDVEPDSPADQVAPEEE